MKKKRLLTDRSGNLQEQLLAEKAKELSDEIDTSIVRQMLVDAGWHQVVLNPMIWEQSYQIDCWVENNIKGRIWNRGLVWLFETDRDAMWFKLKWLAL